MIIAGQFDGSSMTASVHSRAQVCVYDRITTHQGMYFASYLRRPEARTIPMFSLLQ
jgi:hypothetical protein